MPLAKKNTEERFKGIADAAERNQRANEKPGQKTRRNIFIPDNHWKTLGIMADEEGVKTSDLVRRAIKDFIERS